MQLDTHIQKNDPYVLFPHYREEFSGNMTADNPIYTMAYPASIYPVLHLGFPIYDTEGNRLDPGHYEVALSIDKKFLLLIQSKKLVAKVPVIKIETDDDAYYENLEKYNKVKEKRDYYQLHRNKKKYSEYKKELEYMERKLLAKNNVTLDYSNPEYFVIEYYCNFATAIGFIKRASQD